MSACSTALVGRPASLCAIARVASARPHLPQRWGAVMAPKHRPGQNLSPQAAAPAVEAVYQATGVPLVDHLMKLRTVEAALQHSATLVAVAAAGVVVGAVTLRWVDGLVGGTSSDARHRLNVAGAAVASAIKPALVLLPFYGVAFAATVASSLAQVVATKMSAEFGALCHGNGDEVLAVLKWVTQLLQDTSELVLIVFAAWAAIRLKDRIFAWVAAHLTSNGQHEGGIVQLLSPLSAIASFFVFLAAGTTTMSAYGINISGLLASVGGIGVAVGLATQSVAANFVSALSLYSGRAFVVGDRVQLLAAGAPVVEGTVVQIEPLRTVIRDDDGNPVYLSNTEVTACAVRNLSQGAAFKAA